MKLKSAVEVYTASNKQWLSLLVFVVHICTHIHYSRGSNKESQTGAPRWSLEWSVFVYWHMRIVFQNTIPRRTFRRWHLSACNGGARRPFQQLEFNYEHVREPKCSPVKAYSVAPRSVQIKEGVVKCAERGSRKRSNVKLLNPTAISWVDENDTCFLTFMLWTSKPFNSILFYGYINILLPLVRECTLVQMHS